MWRRQSSASGRPERRRGPTFRPQVLPVLACARARGVALVARVAHPARQCQGAREAGEKEGEEGEGGEEGEEGQLAETTGLASPVGRAQAWLCLTVCGAVEAPRATGGVRVRLLAASHGLASPLHLRPIPRLLRAGRASATSRGARSPSTRDEGVSRACPACAWACSTRRREGPAP